MSAKSTQDHYAKIQIGLSSKGAPKEIKLNRIQFELLFFSIPVVLIWGVASTAILFRTLYLTPAHTRPNPAGEELALQTPTGLTRHKLPVASQITTVDEEVSAQPTELSATITKPQQTSESVRRADSSGSTGSIVASRSFQVEDIFGIDLKIIADQEPGSFTVDVDMKNLKGLEESGTFWISLQAVTQDGEKVWVTPMPDVDVDASGQAELPQLGERFSFRTLRKSRLSLETSLEGILKFDQVMIGFNRNNKSPTIAKVNLSSR